MKENVLTETYKKNWAGQHSELLNWIMNGQFKSKMNLPLEKVGKIPLGALTIGVTIQINDETEERVLNYYQMYKIRPAKCSYRGSVPYRFCPRETLYGRSSGDPPPPAL